MWHPPHAGRSSTAQSQLGQEGAADQEGPCAGRAMVGLPVAALAVLAAPVGGRSHKPQGVLLWAEGRSATDTFCETLKRTVSLKYCNGHEESFSPSKNRPPLTRKNLGKCSRKNQLLAHVKPSHLREDTDLATPELLMGAARGLGYGVVVADFRANQLAREVSSFERDVSRERASRDAASDRFCGGGIKTGFAANETFWRRGVDAARAAHLKVVEVAFRDIVAGACATVDRVTRLLTQCQASRCVCREDGYAKHLTGRPRGEGLAGRTSPAAADCLRRELGGDPRYAWMLNLSRVAPP